jgi:bla regulator protein blaR1
MSDWLFDTLIATSGLLLLVLLLRRYVARNFGASVAYWLWLVPALRLFMPSLTTEVADPLASGGVVTNLVRDAVLAAPANTAGAPAATAHMATIDWAAIGVSFWLGGAALLFIVQMVRYCSLRDELLTDAIEIDRIGQIRVVESDRIGGPLAFGLFRRFIAVPDHFTRTFSPQERELALAHELAHHRSGDLYANLAAFLFLCLQWFNPLAWMAWNAFRFDQEAACDARVLDGADTQTRQSYGRALARSAADQMPALAMALNSPRTIVERLRRVMMKDTSKRRRLVGRLAIIGAAAIALPMTATFVPVFAEDAAPNDGESVKTTRHKTKIIIIKGKDGETHRIDVSGDADTPYVKTIEKDGKTIILRSKISAADIEKMLEEAEESRADAEEAAGEAEAARGEAEAASGEAEAARADAAGQIAFAMAMVPEIEFRQARGNCKGDGPVSSDVTGFDGKNKSRVRIVMCGKGQTRIARMEAIKGMREAQSEVRSDKDIPDNVRQSVLDSLEKQIDRMEDQLSDDSEPDDEA